MTSASSDNRADGSEMMGRLAEKRRTTRETDVYVKLDLDGKGDSKIATGIGFLDHMLDLFARHGLFDLEVTCKGDLHIDPHHTVEDTAITLGQAFSDAVGDKAGIVRFGTAYVPMDETLARAVVDLSGRAFTVYHVQAVRDRIGELDVELVQHFWRSFAGEARCNLHIELLYGSNQHHITEAVFKSAARALSAACRISDRIQGVLSTKGTL
jgi:imidazoleglycerol-phosphate dehydratase